MIFVGKPFIGSICQDDIAHEHGVKLPVCIDVLIDTGETFRVFLRSDAF